MEYYKNLSLENLTQVVDGILITEEWVAIKDFEGLYDISNFGRVKSLKRLVYKTDRRKGTSFGSFYADKILSQDESRGYLIVTLSKNSKSKRCSVHRLVASHFIANPENKKTVNHKKGIKKDNRAWELEWNTHSENNKHAFDKGLSNPKVFKAESNYHIASKPIVRIEKDGSVIHFESASVASRELGLSKNANVSISNCCIGKSKTSYGFEWMFLEHYQERLIATSI